LYPGVGPVCAFAVPPWRLIVLGLALAVAGAGAHAEDAAVASAPGPQSAWPQLLSAQYTYVLQHQTALTSPYAGPLSRGPA